MTADRRSPLGAYADRFAAVEARSGAALRFVEEPFRAQVELRLDPGGPAAGRVGRELGVTLPPPGTSAATADGLRVLGLGPDEWLVLGPPGREGELVARLDAATGGEHASVVDVSAARTTVLVAGARARDVLAHGCALDLHPRVLGPGRCAATMLARAQVVLLAGDGAVTVLVGASFARYLADWLLDAATEYVGRPDRSAHAATTPR